MGIFKNPTEEDINDAIRLILWRCRDASLHENPTGHFQLNDWITNTIISKKKIKGFEGTGEDAVRELGIFCADIQELNTGSRDS